MELAGGAPRQCINVKPANLSPASLPARDDDDDDEEEEEEEEEEEQDKQGEDVVLQGGALESLAAKAKKKKMAEEKVATPAKKEANLRRLRRHLRDANAAWGGDGTLSMDEFVAAMTTLDCNGKGSMLEGEAEGSFAVFSDQVGLLGIASVDIISYYCHYDERFGTRFDF